MPIADLRRQTRRRVEALALRLAEEYSAGCPAGVVMAAVFRAREELFAHGVRAGILEATEAAARTRLRQRGIEPDDAVARL